MYNNFTNMTAGELSSRMGIMNRTPLDTIPLTSFNNLDELRMTASQNKVQYLLDLVPFEKIIFSEFAPEENGFISMLYYSNTGTVNSVINKTSSTVGLKREDNSIKFDDTICGHMAILHAMLRIIFTTTIPNDTILGHAHNLFTTILYSIIIRAFNRDYTLSELKEEYLACIRYACACISAAKHFELSTDINTVAIPMTKFMFNRVNPSFYATENNIVNYDAFCQYISAKVGLGNIDKPTFINAVIRMLGYRSLVILESGLDFIIDCMLSKTSAQILSRNLYKIIGLQQYVNLHNKIGINFYNQVNLNIPDASY